MSCGAVRGSVTAAWLLVLLLVPLAGLAFEFGEANFETVGDAESIPDNNVSSLAEDRDGVLWIGTPDGLLRFDGYRFRRYAHSPGEPRSLAGFLVHSLLVDHQGRLWAATDTGGVSRLDPERGDFDVFAHDPGNPRSLAHDTVRALALDPRGGIWIGTQAGLDYWRDDQSGFEHHRHRADDPSSLGEDRIRVLRVSRRGDLWVGTWSGVYRRPAGSPHFERLWFDPQRSDPRDPLRVELIRSLFELDDGRMLIGTTQSGCFVFDPATGQTTRISPAMVLAMAQPFPDELWLGVVGGIDVHDAASGALLRTLRPDPAISTRLAHSDVRAFLRDRAGLLWIGGYGGGLQRFDPRNRGVRTLRYSPSRGDGLAAASVGSVIELADGRIAVGTRGAGVDLLDRKRGVTERLAPDVAAGAGLGNGVVMSLAQTPDGALWIGTLAGLFRYDFASRRYARFGIENGLPGSTIRRLFVGRDGRLWIGSHAGLATLGDDGGAPRIVAVGNADGTPNRDEINAIVEASDGRLWVGSSSQLYTLDPGGHDLRQVGAEPGDPQGRGHDGVVGLLVDSGDRLYVDSAEGLYRLLSWDGERARFDALSRRLGIAGHPFGANLLEDANGRIWTQRYRYNPRNEQLYELTRADGVDLGTPWFRAYAKTRDGLLLFGGSRGLLILDPVGFQPWNYLPPVVASELKIDGAALPGLSFPQGIVLQPGQRRFSLEFAALDFTAPQRLSYAYQLEGMDEGWITTDAGHRVASYGNLWPGEYRLRVRGSNRAGTWSPQQLVVPVRVLPVLWQTPWFMALASLAAIVLVVAAFRWRTARISARADALERMVELRTAELSQAKERAETALRDLQQTQKQLVVAEKMAALGQLVAGVAHEINTPLGVAVTAASAISDETERLGQRLASGELRRNDLSYAVEQLRQASALVNSNLGRTAELVRSFKQVSAEQSMDTRQRFDLGEFLHILIEALKPLWRQRPLQLELQMPEPIELDSYPDTLGQVISQLIHNALFHAYADTDAGTMRLAVRRLSAERMQIEFSDDGQGIAAEHLPRLFEPFFTTRRAQGGTGLGLHTVFNLVTARLGGSIEAHSTRGHGTRFVIILPLQAPE